MLDRAEFEPVFFAPFVSSPMKVERDWIDYNGHLTMAYYNLIFDRATSEALCLLGLGPRYAQTRGGSYFIAETHVRFLRELPGDAPVRVTVRLIDYDEKRLHLFLSLHHGSEGWVSATSEQTALHVNLRTRHASPFPDDVLERIATMNAAHRNLPEPEGLGRRVTMRARARC